MRTARERRRDRRIVELETEITRLKLKIKRLQARELDLTCQVERQLKCIGTVYLTIEEILKQ